MDYIRITKDNIEKEHICCAMSGSQASKKKEWMKKQFDNGLVFYRSAERGKCFIEYIDAENAWAPIDAPGYLFINCLWISGAMKGHGYSRDLLDYCIKDALQKGKDGLCILSSRKKKGFLSDPKYLAYKGFRICDETATGFTLMYLSLTENGTVPKFKENAKKGTIPEKGLVVFYTHQCPFTYYWVPREQEALRIIGIEMKAVCVDSKEQAQSMSVPVTNYALFKDGRYITHEIQSEKKIIEIATKNE